MVVEEEEGRNVGRLGSDGWVVVRSYTFKEAIQFVTVDDRKLLFLRLPARKG